MDQYKHHLTTLRNMRCRSVAASPLVLLQVYFLCGLFSCFCFKKISTQYHIELHARIRQLNVASLVSAHIFPIKQNLRPSQIWRSPLIDLAFMWRTKFTALLQILDPPSSSSPKLQRGVKRCAAWIKLNRCPWNKRSSRQGKRMQLRPGKKQSDRRKSVIRNAHMSVVVRENGLRWPKAK